MRIAMIGQRGLPATFGGVERHVEKVGGGLAAQGHDVVVFGRNNYRVDDSGRHLGMQLRWLPSPNTKHLEAVVHSAISTVSAMSQPFDIMHYHAVGPGLIAPLPRYFSRSTRVVLTVHALDAERAKWQPPARRVLQLAERMSAHVPDRTIVVSRALQRHFLERYGRSTVYAPNGVDLPPLLQGAADSPGFGLQPRSYLLFVGRLVPEKAPDLLVRAFRRVTSDVRLVITGGSSFTADYARKLRDLASIDPRVVLTGYVYGEALEALYHHALAFVLPSVLEGLPLTLLEAASHGLPVVVSDIPAHLEILGPTATARTVFRSGSEHHLIEALVALLADGRRAMDDDATALHERVASTYKWSKTVTATEQAYADALGAR